MVIEVHPPTGSRRVLPLYLGPGVTIQVVVPRLGAFLGLGPRERAERAIRKGQSGKYLDSVVLVKNKPINSFYQFLACLVSNTNYQSLNMFRMPVGFPARETLGYDQVYIWKPHVYFAWQLPIDPEKIG
jgi:hypothetical protein